MGNFVKRVLRGKTGALSAYDACRSRTKCTCTVASALLQNGLVQLGRGLAVRQASRLVPACTERLVTKWPKNKALSISKKKLRCGRKKPSEHRAENCISERFLNLTQQKGHTSIMNVYWVCGKSFGCVVRGNFSYWWRTVVKLSYQRRF